MPETDAPRHVLCPACGKMSCEHLAAELEQLRKDLAAAELRARTLGEETANVAANAAEELEDLQEAHRQELHAQHYGFTQRIQQLEAELARAREGARR